LRGSLEIKFVVVAYAQENPQTTRPVYTVH
jgi:hypothetical protein